MIIPPTLLILNLYMLNNPVRIKIEVMTRVSEEKTNPDNFGKEDWIVVDIVKQGK